jgi:polyphenol oxidase
MWTIEHSAIGRIVVPPLIPEGFGVFVTTRDHHGKIDTHALMTIVKERFNIDAALTTCRQIHSANVVRASHGGEWRECDDCDALWSDETHVALGIKVADCLPVTMIDPAHSIIANVHSGWRGAVQQITSETLDALQRSSAFDTASSLAFLGPSIRVCCFEVGEEVASQFDERFIDRSREKPHVDLPAMTAGLLRERGFAAERIVDSQLCTRCDDSIFHSYRRDGKGGGRNLVMVAQ